jgi:hypothetical protein
MAADSLTLKWGSLKGWKLESPRALALLGYWINLGVCASAVMHRDTPEQKRALCDLIDCADLETVCLDWDGKDVTKEEAKAYILKYGEETTDA